jgi:hypothetical protein
MENRLCTRPWADLLQTLRWTLTMSLQFYTKETACCMHIKQDKDIKFVDYSVITCLNAAITYKPVRSWKIPVSLTLLQINNNCVTRKQKQMASCSCLQMSLVSSMERRRKTQQAEIFTPPRNYKVTYDTRRHHCQWRG